MLKLKNKYIGKVFHCLDELDKNTIDLIVRQNKELFDKYFEEK